MGTNVVERLQVDIASNATQLQIEMAKGEQAIRRVAKATGDAASLQQGLGQRTAQAATQIASSFESMARAGQVGGDALKQVITQGANVAFMFGAQGAVVGAVGVASLAILELFRRTRDETKKLSEETSQILDDLQNRGDVTALTARARQLFQGTPAAGFTDGIKSLREELAKLGAEIEASPLASLNEDGSLNDPLGTIDRTTRERLESVRATLAKLEQEFAEVRRRIQAQGPIAERSVPPIRTTVGRTTATSAPSPEAELARANAVLDAIQAKARENQEVIRDAVTASMLQLAEMAGDTVAVLGIQIDQTTEKFTKLGASGADLELIIKPLEIARKSAEALRGAARSISIPEQARKDLGLAASGVQAATEKTAKAGASFASSLSNALDVALGIAVAIEGVNESTTRLISGAAQAAGGFAKLVALAAEARAAAKKLDPDFSGSGLAALFSSREGLTAVLPGIGAIVGGIASIVQTFGKEDPATRALREALDRNARRLEEFTSSVGDLVQISVSGADAAAVRGLRTQFEREIGRDQQTDVPIFETLDRTTAELLDELRAAGVGLKELQQIAEDFGVTFANAEFPTPAEIRQLQDFIRANALKKLTDSLAGQLKILELQARVDPEAFEGIAGVIRRIEVLTKDRTGIPALRTALEGIDFTSADGPAQALARLRQLLEDFTTGTLDLALLGDLSPEDFAETIAALIESIRAATPALRTPAEKFQAAIEAFATAAELGTLTAQEKLAKAQDLFATLFPDLAASVDTTSAAAFKESIRSIIDSFAADGDLSDAEQAQIAVLRALLEAFEGATPAAEALADALSVLADRFEIFGTSARDQITAILEEVTGDASIGKTAGFALLRGLVDGLDLATTEGQSELRARAQAIFEQLAAGGITTEEQAVVDTIRRILGLAGEVADEAARAAAEALAEADRLLADEQRRRRRLLDAAETDIRLNDITDPAEQLRIRLAALAEAFPAFAAAIADVDVTTQEGRDALEAWIRALAASPEQLEALATAMGVTVEDLVASLLGLEDGADAASRKVATLADALAEAFESTDFETELEGITDPLERLRRTSAAVGDVLPEIAAIFRQFSLDTVQGRAGAEAALIALGKSTSDTAVRAAVLKLLAQIRGVPAPDSTLGGGAGITPGGTSGEGRANVLAAASISEVTGNRLVDLFQRNVVATEGIYRALSGAMSASIARATAPLATLSAPPLPGIAGSMLGAGTVPAGGFSVNVTLQTVFSGPVTTADSDQLSLLVQRRVLELVQGEFATELLVALRRAGISRSN